MKVTLLPSAFSSSGAISSQYLTTFVINHRIAIDAGVLGLLGTPEEQSAIRNVFLTHSHLDHWATLPIFLLNVFALAQTDVKLYASEEVLESLRTDVFNGRVWPNFLEMAHDGHRFVETRSIRAGDTVEVDGLRITAVSVNHVVPTLGYIIDDGIAAVVVVSDTAATTEIWDRAEKTPSLKAVFLEATLPNAMGGLAGATKHLTPEGFVAEMKKLYRPATFFAVHLSARTRGQVASELQSYNLPNVEIMQPGKTYEF